LGNIYYYFVVVVFSCIALFSLFGLLAIRFIMKS